MNEVQPVENIGKNQQSFVSCVKEVPTSHKQQDNKKQDNLSQRNCQNHLSHPSLTQIE